MTEEYAAIFKEEASELLEELESALLELEESPDDLKIVGRVFRAMHTIKGSGAMFGFDDIADFTHHVETVLDKVREGAIPATKKLIDLVLVSRDHISNLLAFACGEGEVEEGRGEEIIRDLQSLDGGGDVAAETGAAERMDSVIQGTGAGEVEPGDDGLGAAGTDGIIHYRINFRPTAEFFSSGGSGGDVANILHDLEGLGELDITGQSQGTDESYAAGEEEAFWDLLLDSGEDTNTIRDVFIFAENTSEIKIQILGSDSSEETFPEHQKLGDILVERGELAKETLKQVLSEQKPLGAMLVEKKVVASEKVHSALNEQKIMAKKRQMKVKAPESLRVAADKLDHLINLVGEMVVTQARLTQAVSGVIDAELIEPVEEVERLTAELRDCVLNIRMLPIGSTFSRFKRLVRDLSDELGKEVELVMEGQDTELDKSVIELMGDPLVHLIRNSIDHGIESPEQRVAAGKPRKGTIKLSAIHSGAHVVIQVIDDGKGLDLELIRANATQKGIITEDSELNESEGFDLIFGAGISTAKEVTEVSGRGVGMDVVKSTIEGRLKGSVQVTSEKGFGSTVTITLPLTLAIIDGLLVKVSNTHFVLPLTQVEECFELTADDIKRFHGRQVYEVRQQLVPYVNLRKFFSISSDESLEVQQMVIVNVNGERVGLVLDDVVGGHQTVIKSLGWAYRNAEGVSGATILGNGEVALIVDVASLVRHAQQEELAA